MPPTDYCIPSTGETVILDVPPQAVGLYGQAHQGDLFEVVRTTIENGGLHLTVTPKRGDGKTYRPAAEHVTPHDEQF